MAWCPNCKTEYRDGITKCADCGADLVNHIEETANACVARFEEKETASKFLEFLNYSEIKHCELSFDSEQELFLVFTSTEHFDEAQKLFHTFRQMKAADSEDISFSEAEEIMKQEQKDVAITKIMPESSTTYVKKKDRYNDLRSTFWIFMLFGIFGLIFTALNVANVLNFFNSYFQYTVLTIVCLFFIFVAVKSLIESKQMYHEIAKEDESTSSITDWLKEHMTPEELSKFEDPTLADEVIYFKKVEYMKAQLFEAFDIDSESYADELIEDYYNQYLES